MFSLHNSYIVIHTDNIRRNVRSILAALPAGCELIPVLKGDAYGLGLSRMAEVMCEFEEIKTIAVSQVAEAAALPETGRDVMLIGAVCGDEQLRFAAERRLIVPAYRRGIVTELARQARSLGTKGRVNIKLNCGLNRFGAAPGAELDALIDELESCGDDIIIEGVYGHFSDLQSPDGDRAASECARFTVGLAQLFFRGIRTPKKHLCASAGFELHPEMARDAVRIGRRLYYDNPKSPTGGILDAASWRTSVAAVRVLRGGESIGYSGTFTAAGYTRIGIIPVGYGDGLKAELAAAGAPVLINGRLARLVGCCMDCAFVELGDAECSVGDEVTLFGYDSMGNLLPGQEVAGYMDDEAVTLTAALTNRVQRVYE